MSKLSLTDFIRWHRNHNQEKLLIDFDLDPIEPLLVKLAESSNDYNHLVISPIDRLQDELFDNNSSLGIETQFTQKNPTWIEHLKSIGPDAEQNLKIHFQGNLHEFIYKQISIAGFSVDNSVCENIEQKTWSTALEKIQAFSGTNEIQLYGWLQNIARNHIRNQILQNPPAHSIKNFRNHPQLFESFTLPKLESKKVASDLELQNLLFAVTDALLTDDVQDIDAIVSHYAVTRTKVDRLIGMIRRLHVRLVGAQPSRRFVRRLKHDLVEQPQNENVVNRMRYLPPRVQIAAGIALIAGFMLLSRRRMVEESRSEIREIRNLQ